MNDDNEVGSLADQAAAWVPPWQRATAATGHPDQPDGEIPDDEPEDEQRPETDRLADAPVAGREPGGGDDDEEDPERPETDVRTIAAAAGRAGPAPVPPAPTRPADLAAAIEAIMMVVDVPVGADAVAEVLGVGEAEVAETLARLSERYAAEGRGFDLRRAAGGWRVYSRAEYAPYVERFVLDGQSVRLTQAALETLAVVAYQQPVTRARMSAIRGVNCDGVVRTLTTRGLIEECGTQPESGAFLYRTTPLFLEKLGLDSLDQLPPLAPFLPDDLNGLIDA